MEIIVFLQHPECANRIKHLSYGYQLDFHKFQTWSSDVGSGETKRLPDRFVPPFSSLWFQSWSLFSKNWALEKNATKATAKPNARTKNYGQLNILHHHNKSAPIIISSLENLSPVVWCLDGHRETVTCSRFFYPMICKAKDELFDIWCIQLTYHHLTDGSVQGLLGTYIKAQLSSLAYPSPHPPKKSRCKKWFPSIDCMCWSVLSWWKVYADKNGRRIGHYPPFLCGQFRKHWLNY